MSGPAEPVDANTARLLHRLGKPLHVLSDPSVATARPRPADAPDLLHLRGLARDIRQHTLDHLDGYLEAFRARVREGGGQVDLADDAAAARRIIDGRLGTGPAQVLRSPVCDEIGLAAAASPAPVAIVAAAFVVAETGQVCVASDDPAIAMATEADTLICVAGIEAVVPRVADLAIMLKLLARSASGRPMTAYTLLVDPGRVGRSLHVVLLDNGRSDLLAGEFRPVLRCIGCGACTNVCPVYRSADVAPAGLWGGAIGAITRPLLRPSPAAAELPHASTLCGSCADACPVRIDLPAHLIALRARSPRMTIRLRLWAWVLLSPTRFRWAARLRRRRSRDPWPTPTGPSFHDRWRQRPR